MLVTTSLVGTRTSCSVNTKREFCYKLTYQLNIINFRTPKGGFTFTLKVKVVNNHRVCKTLISLWVLYILMNIQIWRPILFTERYSTLQKEFILSCVKLTESKLIRKLNFLLNPELNQLSIINEGTSVFNFILNNTFHKSFWGVVLMTRGWMYYSCVTRCVNGLSSYLKMTRLKENHQEGSHFKLRISVG